MAKTERSSWSRSTGVVQFFLLLMLLPAMLDYSLYQVVPSFKAAHSSFSMTIGDFTHTSTSVRDARYDVALICAVLSVLFALFVLIASLFSRRWLALLAFLAPGLVAGALLLSRRDELLGMSVGQWVHLATKIPLLWFILRGRILTKSCLFFPVFAVVLAGIGVWYDDANMAWGVLSVLVPMGFFAVFVLGVRFVGLALIQNLQVMWMLGPTRTVTTAFRTFLFWWPILLFAIPSELVNRAIHEATVDAVYEQEFVRQHGASRALERDLRASVDERFRATAARGDAAAEKMQRSLGGVPIGSFPDKAGAIYEDIVDKDLGMKDPEYSGFWGPAKELAASIAIDQMEKAYAKIRANMKAKLVEGVESTVSPLQSARGDSQDAVRATQAEFKSALRELNSAAQDGITAAYRTMNSISWVLTILFALLCFRTYLYVFGRVAFTKRAGIYVSVEPGMPDAPAVSRTVSRGIELELDSSTPEVIFASRKFEPRGRAPRFVIPQRGAAFLPRLRNGCVTMNRVDLGDDLPGVSFSAVRGAEFVEWELAEGESVVFDWKNFVAMSESVQLSAAFSFRASTLLLGKVIFSKAKGPGRLILMTNGRPVTSESPASARGSVPPSRLVSWVSSGKFGVDSELRLADVYMSGIYLTPTDETEVVIDADKPGSGKLGLARFIKYFLFPA